MKKIFTLLFIAFSFGASAQTHVVISQVYGGGGNTGAPYKNDFVELYNPTASSVNITGWSVQYTSSTGTSFASNLTTLTGIIPAGKYFLIQEASGGTPGVALPAPDATGTINMSATSGKLALVNVSTGLPATSGCPFDASVVDFVGYGTAANCSEGAVAPAPSNTLSDIRNAANLDTDNNSIDFTTSSPNPRNSSFVLPITLQNFSANKNGNNTDIHWQVNCLSTSVTFELQRSNDAINFQTFYTSSETKARCAAPFQYENASTTSGKNYYRLKIIDVDGKVSYSNVALIVNGISDKGLLTVRPTIVTSQADVYYTSPSAEKIQWIITDMQGRISKKITTNVIAGENKISIPAADLNAGQYQLKGFTSEGSTATTRFVKQ